MKHSIVVKFIAIALCAASLLAAVAGGLSIIVLAEHGLYEKTVDEVYAERVEDVASSLAEDIAQSYASRNLGNCSDEMIGHFYYLNYGYYDYTLRDAAGHELESLTAEYAGEYPGRILTYEFSTSGSYMNVLDSYPAVDDTEEGWLFGDGYGVYDGISDAYPMVYSLFYSSSEHSESFGGETPIGYITHNEAGQAHFAAFGTGIIALPEENFEPDHIAFFDENGEVIYEISNVGGVGILYREDDGQVCFTANLSTVQAESTSVAPTEAPMEYTATEPAMEYAMDLTSAGVENTQIFNYYDAEAEMDMVVEYEWVVLPEYSVTMTVYPGALYNSEAYTLAGVLSTYRAMFPWLLAAGLLLFAVTAVYLCCAAGRKSGVDGVHPAGLNRFPLDAYAFVCVFGLSVLYIAAEEAGTALFREDTAIGLGFVAGCGYLGALLVVGFCFAFAAQFKTPGGYWYRGTVCGRCLRLLMRLIRWLDTRAVNAWPVFCNVVKALWRLFKRAVVGIYKFVEMVLIKVCALLGRFLRWIGKLVARFFSMLPLTWQWLLTGFVMMFLLLIGIAGRYEGLMLLSICGCVAIILYGAQCFGLLLENAKRRCQGDLDDKVEDKYMVGSFKDFAGELNGLADVATVAVQKQLKSERMKTELITNVSHDIKTPLTSIINYVDLMKKPHSDAENEQYLEVLDRQSQRLKKLIDDLMEMSKASTGNIAVELTKVDAAEAVNQALGEFADKLATRDLTPVFHHPEEQIMILADGRLVWRVLSNLLSNAYKYALPGTRLYLDLMVLDGNGVIAIKNISQDQLNVDAEELMERFVRGDASRNTEGSGLGLNIAKSLVELQQGKMHLMVDGDLFKVTLIFPLA